LPHSTAADAIFALEDRLARSQAIAREAQANDRRRLADPSYDPPDLVGGVLPCDPSVSVSDAGLDRGPVTLLRHHAQGLTLEGTRNSRYDTEQATPHLTNRIQNPLDFYYRRDLLEPSDRGANRAYWRAGRRLRADWKAGGHQPRLTGDLTRAGPSGRVPATPDDVLDAWERLQATLNAVNPIPRMCVIAVCCADQLATDWAASRTWPKPESALDILRIALDTLTTRYAQWDRDHPRSA
jgi:hypothetical protein